MFANQVLFPAERVAALMRAYRKTCSTILPASVNDNPAWLLDLPVLRSVQRAHAIERCGAPDSDGAHALLAEASARLSKVQRGNGWNERFWREEIASLRTTLGHWLMANAPEAGVRRVWVTDPWMGDPLSDVEVASSYYRQQGSSVVRPALMGRTFATLAAVVMLEWDGAPTVGALRNRHSVGRLADYEALAMRMWAYLPEEAGDDPAGLVLPHSVAWPYRDSAGLPVVDGQRAEGGDAYLVKIFENGREAPEWLRKAKAKATRSRREPGRKP